MTQWTRLIIQNCLYIQQNKGLHYPDSPNLLHNLRLNDMYFRKAFIQTGEFSSIVGAYFGICMDTIYLGGTPQRINVTNSKLKALGRFIIAIVLHFGITYPPQILYRAHAFSASSYGSEYLFRSSLPNFFANFILFSYLKLFYQKYNLVAKSHQKGGKKGY